MLVTLPYKVKYKSVIGEEATNETLLYINLIHNTRNYLPTNICKIKLINSFINKMIEVRYFQNLFI